MAGNYIPKNSLTFVLNMELKDNSLHPTLHSIMEWTRGDTAQSHRWTVVLCWLGVFQTGFGLRHCSRQYTCWIDLLQWRWSKRLRRKPNVNHLKVFGSIAYPLIPNEKKTKLNPKRKKLMIMTYNNSDKAYKLVYVKTSQLSFSRDIVVDLLLTWLI
jgi:hypothetical protein